jgi:hypothetical protein
VSPLLAASLLLLGLLTVARLTRAVVSDRVGLPIRRFMLDRFPAEEDAPDGLSPWAYLVHCRWCTSLWLAVPVAAVLAVLLADGWIALALVLPLALSLSHLTGLLVALEPED